MTRSRPWLAALAVLAGLSPFLAVLGHELSLTRREWRQARESEALLEQGRELRRVGEPARAVELLAARVREKPDDAELRTTLGAWRLDAGDVAGARADLEQVLAHHPDHVGAHNNLGLVAEREGDAAEARREYEAAIRLAPGHTRAHQNLGALHLREGRVDAAIAELRTALQVDPDAAGVHARLGVALLRGGRPAEARVELARALELDPRQEVARRQLAALERQQAPNVADSPPE